MRLLLLQAEGGEALWIWLVILLIPALGRLAGWVIEKLGGGPVDPEERGKKIERRRERGRELERRGQEMWKRLLEGGESAPEEPASPASPPRERPPAPRQATLVRESAPEPAPPRLPRDQLPSVGREPTLERKLVASRPSEHMPDLAELEQHRRSDSRSKADLEADEVGDELGRVAYLDALGKRSEVRSPAEADAGLALPREPDDWRRAVVWSEILRPPVALRDPANEDLPALR